MKGQDEVIDSFLNTVYIQFEKGKLSYCFKEVYTSKHISNSMFVKLDHLEITKNMKSITFRILDIDDRYLQLATIGKISIVFDKSITNEAGEWNIINRETGFVITKTLSSFLHNKVWAWLDRSRCVWEEETY